MTRRFRRRGSRPARTSVNLTRVIFLFLIIAGAALCADLYWGPGPATADATSRTLVLDRGGGVQGLADSLAHAGAIHSALAFVVAAEVTGAAHYLKAGEYRFASGASLRAVLNAVSRGDVVHHWVTIPEGLTSRAAAEILRRAEFLSGPCPVPPEGALLPETYEAMRSEACVALIAQMTRAREAKLSELWRERAPGLPFKTPQQAVILASIVERETALADERAHVASVYIHRLQLGMRLQSDPTVIYGLTSGEPLGHGLRRSELDRITPYNTYRLSGLPPTPIGNPGRASLAAVLRPASSHDLYFVANGRGGHVFAASLAEHSRNVARWRTLESFGLRKNTP